MLPSTLGALAATWGIVMALAPALQIRQMLRTRSSEDLSIGYFLMLLPGFVLWCCYGTARSDWFLAIPNAIAAVGALATILIARHFRRPHADHSRH